MSPEIKYDLVKKEWELTQSQMDKYDGLSSKVKTWAVTLWVALVGWSWQVEKRDLLLLAALVAAAFWLLDSVEKNFRQDYGGRREEVAAALRHYAETGQWPAGFLSPDLPKHRTAMVAHRMFGLHTMLVYLPILLIALVLYWR